MFFYRVCRRRGVLLRSASVFVYLSGGVYVFRVCFCVFRVCIHYTLEIYIEKTDAALRHKSVYGYDEGPGF